MLISLFGLVATPPALVPWGWAVLVLVVAGGVADCLPAATGRGAVLALVLAVARVCAISLLTQNWGPQPNLWAVTALTTTAITVQWEWSWRVAVPVTAGVLAVHVAVTGLAGSGGTVLRVALECALARLMFVVVRREGRRVDDLRTRRAALERAAVLALARRRREREYLALLHDTAAVTFQLVAARGAARAAVAEYARHDLSALTAKSTQDSAVDIAVSLRAVVDRAPLAVGTRWRDVPLVPASVVLAIVRAVREALTNVARHAGVGTAVLAVRGTGDGVTVEISDTGTGFDPGAVPPHRRGLRGSVVERMAAVGGRAEIASRPGAGTTVRLVWPDG
ncbi:sensor histidine kinase [Actinophytocola sp. KF-1]